MVNKWCLFSLLLINSCSGSTHMSTQKPLPAFDTEGHRGCRGLMPENTIPAMLKALDLGVTTLEMDAAITSDGKVILSHEPFFNHEFSTDPNGEPVTEAKEKSYNIHAMTYAQTTAFDVGKRQNPRYPKQMTIPANKPLLAEVIDNAEAYAKLKNRPAPFYDIETKTNPATDGLYHPAPEEFVKILMKVIRQKKIGERVVIQSFDFRTLKIIHQNYPEIRTSALIEGTDHRSVDAQLAELGFIPDIYSPYFALVTDTLVRICREKKMKLVPWTVNDLSSMEKLKKMGVDGIISDYPDLFLQLH